MNVTDMMDAYTVPLLRISSMTTSADPIGDPPNARGAYLPGKLPQQLNFATMMKQTMPCVA